MQIKRFFNVVLLFAFTVLVILPARFYQTYALGFFAVESNIMVNYLNVVDLFAFLIMLICLVRSGSYKSNVDLLIYFVFVLALAFIESLLLLTNNNAVFIGELISKANIIICAFIFGKYVSSNFTDKGLYLLYFFPILILVISSFFLRNYGGYASSNRVGTLGFGSNETAMFACILLCFALFKRNSNIIVRVLLFLVSIASILIVSSRRGLIVAVIIFAIFLLYFLFQKRKEKINFRTFLSFSTVVIVSVILVLAFKDRIVSFFNSSPLYVRLIVSRRGGETAFDMNDRLTIFNNTLTRIINNPFGTFGSDELLAQDSFSHAHNVLLQFTATHGIILGSFISITFVILFLKSTKIACISLIRNDYYLIGPLAFLIVYFVFDMFGYLLWNPKGLFWVALTISILIFKNKKTHSSFSRREKALLMYGF